MNERWRTTISSPPDREEVVAEIFFGNSQFAELNREANDIRVEIYPSASSQAWSMSLEELRAAINEAEDKLSAMSD